MLGFSNVTVRVQGLSVLRVYSKDDVMALLRKVRSSLFYLIYLKYSFFFLNVFFEYKVDFFLKFNVETK